MSVLSHRSDALSSMSKVAGVISALNNCDEPALLLVSSDGPIFPVDVATAMESGYFKYLIESRLYGKLSTHLPSHLLEPIVCFIKKRTTEKFTKDFESEFFQQNRHLLLDLLIAAFDYSIDSLLDLTRKVVLDMLAENTRDEIREIFNLSQQEMEEMQKYRVWDIKESGNDNRKVVSLPSFFAIMKDRFSSDGEQTGREMQMADAVILVYNDEDSFYNLSTKWLPKLRQFRLNVPVILARCMLKPRRKVEDFSLMNEFPEVVSCIGFSPFIYDQVVEVFRAAEMHILHPIEPLYDLKRQKMTLRCEWALKRIFILSDKDRDGLLSDKELTDLQDKCFDRPINITVVKNTMLRRCQEAFNEEGLNFRGFLIMNELLIEKAHTRMIWTMFRKFGYHRSNSDDGWWLSSIKRTPDQSVELTSEAVKFLRGVFSSSDRDLVSSTLYSLLEPLGMSEAPHSNLDDFVAQWALITLLNPVLSVENLIYLGYADDPSSLVRVTRERSVDRKKGLSDRKVFQCFVFGPKEAGKSSLLQSFVGSPISETYTSTTVERCTVKIVDRPFLWQYPPLGSFLRGRRQKALILREIPEDAIENLLFRKDALAACDVAVFVHDSFDESSWLRAKKLLVQVASHGKSTGYEVPCLIVAAKGDLEPSPTAIQDSTRVSQDLGIEAPISISTKLGDFNDVFKRIVRAAEHPQLSIPEIEAGKTRKLYHRLLNHSLMVVSVVAALNIFGLAAFHVYAATRKNTSSS